MILKNKYSKNISILSLVVCLLLTTINTLPAKAIELTEKINISKDKIWTIKMAQEVSSEDIQEKITVKDSAGEIIPIKITLGDDKSVIYVAPLTSYEDGHTYTLTILKGIISKDKKSALKDELNMSFTVNDTIQVYLNNVKMNFTGEIQPKVLYGLPYIPLEEMVKALKLDTEMSLTVAPNIKVTTVNGIFTTNFNSITVVTPTKTIEVPGVIREKIGTDKKHLGKLTLDMTQANVLL